MALILKQGAQSSIVDTRDTTKIISTPYLIVKRYGQRDEDARSQPLFLDYYERVCTKEERQNGVIKPFLTEAYSINGDMFDTFASNAAIEADDDIATRVYSWLTTSDDSQLMVDSGEVDEEGHPILENKFKDFKSDEI